MTDHTTTGPDHRDDAPVHTDGGLAQPHEPNAPIEATPADIETADAVESASALEGSAATPEPQTEPQPAPATELQTESEPEPVPATEPHPEPSQPLQPELPSEPEPQPQVDGEGDVATVADETGAPVDTRVEVTPALPVAPEPDSKAPGPTSGPSPAAPKPSALPRRPVPTPAALAGSSAHSAVVAPPVITTDHSASAAHGRVDEQGVVYVRTVGGEEKQVGSYPGATPEQALTYFARKYDELFASAVLLEARLGQSEVPSKDVQDALKTLTAQVTDAAVVGDLDALAGKLDEIRSGIAAKRVVEQQHRAQARAAAKSEREEIVAEAETIANQPENRIQWKTSGARMRELLETWKAHQRASTRLDRESETALWQRFSAARNRFDKARRTHFAGLDAAHADAKKAKESLVTQAEKLAVSTDWAATAGAFKRLMDDWRAAGRASRTDDDRLWTRFKTAQDSFFAAKDALVAAEEEGYRGNLVVKESLLKEAAAILPVTDLEKAKSALRGIQDRWDAAGKVPRSDLERVEKAMRRIEQTVRDAEERRWKSSNPEAAARATAMVEQLERAVSGLERDLAAAQESGAPAKVEQAQAALEARRAWLEQARAGVAEFGG